MQAQRSFGVFELLVNDAAENQLSTGAAERVREKWTPHLAKSAKFVSFAPAALINALNDPCLPTSALPTEEEVSDISFEFTVAGMSCR